MTKSLLAHVVAKFSARQWENIATESLLYLLTGSAGGAVGRVLAPYMDVPADLRWHSQASEADSGIPDLVGSDFERRPTVILEGKFWAALTRHQPTSYLARQRAAFPSLVDADAGSNPRSTIRPDHALIFLVPATRQRLIASELAMRLGSESHFDAATGLFILDHEQLVVVVSWGRMLAEVRGLLHEARDETGLADLAQLDGLCDRADTEAMLPFTYEDVDAATARRLWDFYELADLVTDELVRRGLTSVKGHSSAGGKGYYNRAQLALSLNYDVAVSLTVYSWSARYPTPLWLRIWRPSPEVVEAAHKMQRAGVVPHAEEYDNWIALALPIPVGTAAEDAIAQITDRIATVLTQLPPLTV